MSTYVNILYWLKVVSRGLKSTKQQHNLFTHQIILSQWEVNFPDHHMKLWKAGGRYKWINLDRENSLGLYLHISPRCDSIYQDNEKGCYFEEF